MTIVILSLVLSTGTTGSGSVIPSCQIFICMDTLRASSSQGWTLPDLSSFSSYENVPLPYLSNNIQRKQRIQGEKKKRIWDMIKHYCEVWETDTVTAVHTGVLWLYANYFSYKLSISKTLKKKKSKKEEWFSLLASAWIFLLYQSILFTVHQGQGLSE